MENRDIRIAFFDIDGTLLPPDHHLPESTVAALNILRAKGVQLYLATGRPPYHLRYLKKDLPFEFDGMVMMNGQYCRDKDGCFYAHPLPQEGLRELLPWLEKTDIAVSFVEADTAYMNRTNALCENFLKEIPQETIDPAQRCFTYPTYQLSAFLSSEQEPEFMAHVPGCRAVRWSEEFVDILPATGGKVNGFRKRSIIWVLRGKTASPLAMAATIPRCLLLPGSGLPWATPGQTPVPRRITLPPMWIRTASGMRWNISDC